MNLFSGKRGEQQRDGRKAAPETIACAHGPEVVCRACAGTTPEPETITDEFDVLAQHDGSSTRRQWASTGAWLYPGDVIALIRTKPTAGP